MSELFLILHKVRGEPAFDVAQKIMIGDEEGWIIPTSGHRAYPYHTMGPISELCPVAMVVDMPMNWPDHYDAKRDAATYLEQARKILGFTKPKKPAYRRI